MGSRIEGRDHLTAVKRYSRCCSKYDYEFPPKEVNGLFQLMVHVWYVIHYVIQSSRFVTFA